MSAAVRCRVDLKMFGRHAQEWDREKAFRILLNEFRHRCSDAGIMHDIKDRQFFESKSRKQRKKLRDTINRRKQDEIEEKIRRGEQVHGVSGKILKKIRSRDKMNKNKKNGHQHGHFRDHKDRNNMF